MIQLKRGHELIFEGRVLKRQMSMAKSRTKMAAMIVIKAR